MPPSKRVEVTVNGIPAGTFTRFAWHRDGRYLLRLARIDVTCKPHTFTAIAHYHYVLAVEKHRGYLVATANLFGRSWLINITKRGIYVQRIHPETE
jgi:hypothetical protein